MAVIKNKYQGTCNNPACKLHVPVGEGYVQKINNRWVTWCNQCVPERIAAAPVSGPTRVLTADGKIITPYEPQNLPLIKSLPGARWNKEEKFWTVSLDQADRQRLLEVADRIGLEVAPQLRNIVVTEESQNALHAGLYEFQVTGVNWMSKRDRALLGDDMGLGKTVQTLMALPSQAQALVIAPAGLKYNWRSEAEKWRPEFKVSVVNGRGNFRLPQPGEILIVNFDILPDWLTPPAKQRGQQDYYKQVNAWREKLKSDYPEVANVTVVVDEAHNVKNYKAARSKKVKELCRMAKVVWGLTGTPLVNRPGDLYGVLESLNMAYDVFGPWTRFQRLFNAYQGRWGLEWGTPEPVVPELLRRVMLRRRRAEVLPDLPTKTYTTLLVNDVDPKLRKQLDELWDEFGGMIEIGEELPPFEKFSEVREKLARSRVKQMLEYVENAEEQEVPLVVFSAHLAPMDALLGRPGWAVITGDTSPEKRHEIVQAFQAGRLKGVGVTIRAGGVGLTLTHAWKALFVDLDWTPAANTQAEDRICRIGQQSNKVEIVRMVSDHPLDLHVLNLLSLKMALIEAAVEKSVKGVVLPTRPVAQPTDETEEEFQARMARVQAAIEELEKKQAEERAANEKARGKAKAGQIHQREKGRATRPILPLTPERVEAVKDAFSYMLSVCDGAFSRDAQGFNKPDASVARYLVWAGLENQQEIEAAYYMLTRYHRQLSGRYPILFN